MNIDKGELWMAGIFLVLFGLVAYAFTQVDKLTNDPTQEVNPFSAVKVTEEDLRSEKPCPMDLMSNLLRHGFEPTRSDLHYARWRCSIVQDKHASAQP